MTVTIPNVDLIKVGIEYPISGGVKWTPTPEDLIDIVASQGDPAIVQPRIKLGHDDPRFNGGDAEPAFGKISNLRISDDGMTLYGDYTGMPDWLGEIAATAFPSRSIEGYIGGTTVTGNKYRFVLTACALLGVQWPGVSTLDDLQAAFSPEGPEGVTLVAASVPEVRAAVNADDVRRAYYDSLSSDQSWWWIRAHYVDPNELIVDDDDGNLYKVPYTINASGADPDAENVVELSTGDTITFGDPQPVVITFQNVPPAVAAGVAVEGMSAMRRVAASYQSKGESRPDAKGEGVDPKFLEKLGLSADATEDEVLARLDEIQGNGDPPKEPDPEDNSKEGTGTGQVLPMAASAETVTLDKETYELLKNGAQAGIEARAEQVKSHRDTLLDAAIKAGKFPPSRREHWQGLYDADPEGATAAIKNLSEGLIPVEARGHAGSSGETTSAQEEHDAFMGQYFPQVRARNAAIAAAADQRGSGRVMLVDGSNS